MAITKWDPFKELMDIQTRMSRLFEDTVSHGHGRDKDITHAAWTPLVDIYETDNEVILKAELPDIDQKDIILRVEGNNLILEGERKLDEETKKENYYLVERAYGKFKRSFNLPGIVDADKIKAEYKHGVLKVTLPKREETKAKQITIDSK
jgi:HSP20 family protein